VSQFQFNRFIAACMPFALIGVTGLSGCKKQPSPTASPDGAKVSAGTPASSASSGAAGAASGPCAAYANKLCDKAGPETCEAIKTTTDLMPPDACTAGLKDIEFSVKKLAASQKACDELVQKLCEAVGPQSQSCKLVTTETKQFPPEKCKMMMGHLAEVTAELKKMEGGESAPQSGEAGRHPGGSDFDLRSGQRQGPGRRVLRLSVPLTARARPAWSIRFARSTAIGCVSPSASFPSPCTRTRTRRPRPPWRPAARANSGVSRPPVPQPAAARPRGSRRAGQASGAEHDRVQEVARRAQGSPPPSIPTSSWASRCRFRARPPCSSTAPASPIPRASRRSPS